MTTPAITPQGDPSARNTEPHEPRNGQTVSGVTFKVPGPPKGKPRHRTRKGGHSYPDPEGLTWEARVLNAFLASVPPGTTFPIFPKGVPVRLSIILQVELPRSKHRKKPVPAQWCTAKPDWDNAGKLIGDALNGYLWADDAQIVDANAQKYYGEQGQPPFTQIRASLASF